MEERHLSLSEAAEALNISERTAYRWIKSAKLRAYKPGRDYWIPESAIKEVVKESEVRPKVESRSSVEPSLFNGLEGERHASSVFVEILISTAEKWATKTPPESSSDYGHHLGTIQAANSIGLALSALTDDWAAWEERFSPEERREIMSVVQRLHDVSTQLLEQTDEYLKHRRTEAEDREASREAEELRAQ